MNDLFGEEVVERKAKTTKPAPKQEPPPPQDYEGPTRPYTIVKLSKHETWVINKPAQET